MAFNFFQRSLHKSTYQFKPAFACLHLLQLFFDGVPEALVVRVRVVQRHHVLVRKVLGARLAAEPLADDLIAMDLRNNFKLGVRHLQDLIGVCFNKAEISSSHQVHASKHLRL